MSGAPTRAAGASGRPQCRPSSTAPTWRATNRTRRERRDGSPPQSRSGGHPPRQIDRLSDQVATSTPACASSACSSREIFRQALSYLLTKNRLVVRVDEKTLIQRLRLDHLLDPKQRQGSRVRKRIEECCAIA